MDARRSGFVHYENTDVGRSYFCRRARRAYTTRTCSRGFARSSTEPAPLVRDRKCSNVIGNAAGVRVTSDCDADAIAVRRKRLRSRVRKALGASFLATILVGLFTVAAGPRTKGVFFVRAFDFRALYCGGVVTLARANPYRVEPLRTCEHTRPDPTFLAQIPAWAVVPAPYPGYALGIFSVFGLFPYQVSKALWLASLTFSIGVSALALAEITGWSILALAMILVPTGLVANLFLGSAPPLALAGICLAAWACASGHERRAAAPLALAMLDPHLALPSAVVVFLIAPKARVALSIAAAALATVSVVAIGLAANFEYLRSVLGAQARAEVFHHYQYSLTHVLAVAGVPVGTALHSGSLSYALLFLIALYIGTRKALTPLDRARSVLVPVAIVSLGGTYMHGQEVVLALPAVLVMARSARSGFDCALTVVASIGLLFSLDATDFRIGTALYVVACAIVAYMVWKPHRTVGAICVALFAIALATIVHATLGSEGVVAAMHLPAQPGNIRADTDTGVAWEAMMALSPSWTMESPFTVALKIPTWVGLSLILMLALRAAFGERINRARSVNLSLSPT